MHMRPACMQVHHDSCMERADVHTGVCLLQGPPMPQEASSGPYGSPQPPVFGQQPPPQQAATYGGAPYGMLANISDIRIADLSILYKPVGCISLSFFISKAQSFSLPLPVPNGDQGGSGAVLSASDVLILCTHARIWGIQLLLPAATSKFVLVCTLVCVHECHHWKAFLQSRCK